MRSTIVTLLVAATLISSCGRTSPDQVSSSNSPADPSAAGSVALASATAITASASEFEGTYQVGDTHCVVKPVKMAFEVTWEKGNGAMLFFFDSHTPEGKAVFVSETTAKGADRFVFDDDDYDAGTFIRADGKELPVSRATGGS